MISAVAKIRHMLKADTASWGQYPPHRTATTTQVQITQEQVWAERDDFYGVPKSRIRNVSQMETHLNLSMKTTLEFWI